MKILAFEFLTGGGVADQHPLNEELNVFFEQGHSMLKAVCEDLMELGHEVFAPVDTRATHALPEAVHKMDVESESSLNEILYKAASDCDRFLLVAPESDGCLENISNLLKPFMSRCISPGRDFIRLTANKWTCHQWLTNRDVPCPPTLMIRDRGELSKIPTDIFPCVSKPVDGAGSEEVRLVRSSAELTDSDLPILLQKFVPGIPVSVSVISSDDGARFLEPGRQVFDTEPFGIQIRTEFPLKEDLRERAIVLARMVADRQNVRGYFGIDMILADEPNNDVVIEVNPRLTTSYVFLKEWSGENIARHFPFG